MDKRKLDEDPDKGSNDTHNRSEHPSKKGKIDSSQGSSGLWLDTVNRYMLDFDFEKLCSISLTNLNVYACLVCGKYFQGRGKTSHAYFHSLHEDHHVLINLHTLKVYILPDGYEVIDNTLNDIKYVLNPTFTPEQVALLDKVNPYAYDLNNKRYLPGFVGLNNIKANDFVNVVVQAFIHVRPLRDHFLLTQSEEGSELVRRFGMLTRKIWNTRAFKGQVSPHEFLQEISSASQKRFRLSVQSDPIELISWLLNAMHLGMGGKKQGGNSLIHSTFRGELRIDSQTFTVRESTDENRGKKIFDNSREITTKITPFMFLALDLPPPPLFQDEAEKTIIPQIPITTLLEKYDGVTGQETGNILRRYKITKLPQYLIFHIKRFTKNNWTTEKNNTIVNFPLKHVDMAEYVEGPATCGETRYDLLANICHEGKPGPGNGTYKVHVHDNATDQWFMIQDLFVEEIMPQMIFLSESYIQIWERRESLA
ncbi:hypothetical protein DFS34DRAFT_27631 [Phlyctochytrium arcticum]|nr:hypothetical protein DFS34DRAFT_27631 [Phlyctochytrium arcticum]